MRTLEVVVGGQYGSEAKGHVTQRLAERAQSNSVMPQVIRVAGPNAGHTGYDKDGRRWPLRQVPVAAVTQDGVVLGIAPGSEIDPNVLLDEIDELAAAGLLDNKPLWVSDEATIIEPTHIEQESQHGSDLQRKIGSTAKGIGAARAGRIWRQAKRLKDSPELCRRLEQRNVQIRPGQMPPNLVGHTIVEGTQGYGLGLHAGCYPKCTSSDCRAIDFLAMAGINPWEAEEFRVHVVARVYPIRVAGNSGPLLNETSWEELGLPAEHTTVTQKVRRVGLEDWPLVAAAVRANGGAPTVRVALTMLDQKFPHLADKPLFDLDPEGDEAMYIRSVQHEVGAPVEWVATGPNTATNIRFMEI